MFLINNHYCNNFYNKIIKGLEVFCSHFEKKNQNYTKYIIYKL